MLIIRMYCCTWYWVRIRNISTTKVYRFIVHNHMHIHQTHTHTLWLTLSLSVELFAYQLPASCSPPSRPPSASPCRWVSQQQSVARIPPIAGQTPSPCLSTGLSSLASDPCPPVWAAAGEERVEINIAGIFSSIGEKLAQILIVTPQWQKF